MKMFCIKMNIFLMKEEEEKKKQAIPEFAQASFLKRVLVQNLPYESERDLRANEPVGGTHFHKNSFA